MSQAFPSLSLAGFITDIPTVIDKMFSCYLTSDYSQSNLFAGKIVSLQKQVQAYQHDRNMLVTKVREELEGYFGAYADSTTVRVTLDDPNPDDPNRINITLSAVIVKNGKAYSIGKLIETQDSIIMNIIQLNNEGVTQT